MLIDLHLVALLVGVIAGTVGGLMPGFGNLMTMIVLIPFIRSWPALDIIICYAVMTQISQFVGSITSIYTGIPGEPSSMPTVTEAKRLSDSEVNGVIAATSIGSAFAAIVSLAICWIIAPYFINVAWFFRTEIIIALLVTAVFFITYFSKEPFLVSFAMLVAGFAFGSVGWNAPLSIPIGTFGFLQAYQGIPMESAVLMLFAIPQLYQLSIPKMNVREVKFKFVIPSLNYLKLFWYSVIGFIAGFMPGLTTVFSSQLAYNISKALSSKPSERILAAETANNAGAISQLIPLLVLGLPLVASEALALNLMETRGFVASAGTAMEYFMASVTPMIIAVGFGLIVSWPIATYILHLLRMNLKWFRLITLVGLIVIILFQAHVDRSLGYVLICTLAMAPVTWLVRKVDTTVLVFGFLIADRVWDSGVRLVNLYQ